MLVKPDVAKKQLEADAASSKEGVSPKLPGSGTEGKEPPGSYVPGTGGETDSTQRTNPKRFYGSINLDPIRAARDAQQVIEEIVQHLTSLPDATIVVTMDIQAITSDGFPKEIVDTVKANCQTLKFTSQGFEED